MKKVLFVATVYKFLNFESSDMRILKKMGYEIHTATNMEGEIWLNDDGDLNDLVTYKHQISFARTPFSFKSIAAFRQLKKLVNENHYDLIHCHTPVAGAIARLAAKKARKKGSKVIYTDHGFHFHKKSSIKNWLVYYPVEYVMSFFCDMIITVNKEDYEVIQRFPVKEKRYIPGVGVDVERIANKNYDKKRMIKELGIPQDAFCLLSIGELSIRKNQSIVIKALSELKHLNIVYLICGTGSEQAHYEEMTKQLGIKDKVFFLGFRSHDFVEQLVHVVDVGILPSLIEGLGLAGIEMLAAGKPVIASGVHGIKDYVIDGETGIRCNPYDVNSFKVAIERMYEDKTLYLRCSQNALNKAKEFDIHVARIKMERNYKDILNR